MLFPELGPQYYDEKDKPILAKMETSYANSITILQSFWGEADTDTRFYVGDQTFWSDIYGNLPANRRRNFTFNRCNRVVNMISGYQRRNRKSTICIPIENADSPTSDQYTKILMHINKTEGVLETISESFQGALVTGMNLLQVWVDYRSDPISGSIKVDNCSYNSFLIDPYFRKADLSDCNFIWKRTFMSKRQAISMLPDKADDIIGLYGRDNRDGKFQFLPESYSFSTGYKDLLTYDEYYYKDYRQQQMLCDTQTGETLEWKSHEPEKLKAFLKQFPQLTVIEQEVPTVNLAIVVQGKVMYDGPNPMGTDKYPFVPVFAYYHPEMPYFPFRVRGVIRDLRDAQYLYNRRKAIELDILESQINSGYIYKENALVNPKDIFLSGQGKGLALKDDAQMTDIIQIQAPQIPPSMIELSKILAEEINQVSGVNEELLGSASDDKAGILSMLRQGAGLTTLQTLFDQLDRSQKLLGEIILDLIRANYTPGKVQNILENEKPSPQFYNKAFGKYGCAIEEGFNTTSQKQMEFAQLLQLREAGVQVPDDKLLEACTIQDKKKLVESIQQAQQQAAQLQQQQAQLQMAQLEAQIKLANSQATANEGLGIERLSRVQENQALAVERRAAAIKDQDAGLLDLVKAIKEIDNLDLQHIQQLISIAQVIKDQEKVDNQPQEQTQMNIQPTQGGPESVR